MTKDEVKFIELFATVMDPQEAKEVLADTVKKAESVDRIDPKDQNKVVAEQADALVDIWYYSLNAACKKGINLSAVFDIVQAANMAKKDPETGKFLKRADGKIIKPKGWQPPDVVAEMDRQREEGAFGKC